MRKILPRPLLNIGDLLSGERRLPFPLEEKNAKYFGYARTALFSGLISLGIQKGDTVLIPSYICNVILSPLNYLGVKACYYNVGRDLMPDIGDIRSKINKTVKAVLAVNYFGFPTDIQGIKQLCSENGLFYIEDNAHGFLSRYQDRPLGSYGDVSIFSFRKTLPVPNGAVLMVNNGNISSDIKLSLRRGGGELVFLLRQANMNVDDRTGINPVKLIKRAFGKTDVYDPQDESIEEETNLDKYMIRKSFLTAVISAKSDYDLIVKTRRKAFVSWLNEGLDDAEPVFKELSEDVVPYAYPVYANDTRRFISRMHKKGVYCSPWPTLPYDLRSYPDYYRQVVLIPVWRQYGS